MSCCTNSSNSFFHIVRHIELPDLLCLCFQYIAACGGNFVQPSGYFYSPGYPVYYSNNLDCIWVIGVPDNKLIALGFEEFDLEGGDSCRLDYVEVRDGDSQNSPLIGRYCGTTAPMVVRGSSNKFWVRFHSNGFITGKGFEATWITEAQFIKPVNGGPSATTLGDDPQQELQSKYLCTLLITS